ncbi:MAG: aminotransferase class I/II-fold pyridoxal phosphate-dependent enzyme [Lentisphaerota bacterium]
MSGKTFTSKRFDLAVDTISRQDVQDVVSWLKAYPRLTMANETIEFEKAWAKWLGVKYCVMCNSGSSANLLMYAAMDSTKRSGKRRIVVPATGWVTTVAPAIQLNWNPVMCESDSQTFGLDVDTLEKLLKKHHPETVIMVHVLGVPNNMTAIKALQKKYEFQLLEDCCASHGAKHRGRMIGTFGIMSSFSFYYGHHMSTIEGGMVCTNDLEVYHHLLMLRSHGWLKDLPKAKAARMMKQYGVDPFHAPFTFVLPGYNLRPTDLSARVGLIQLPTLNDTVCQRMVNHKVFQKHLEGHFEFAPGIPGDQISSISFCAMARTTEERKKVVKALDKNRIDTRIFTAGNLGRHPFWADRYGVFSAPLADKLYRCGFFLPNNQSLGRREVEFICKVATDAIRS